MSVLRLLGLVIGGLVRGRSREQGDEEKKEKKYDRGRERALIFFLIQTEESAVPRPNFPSSQGISEYHG